MTAADQGAILGAEEAGVCRLCGGDLMSQATRVLGVCSDCLSDPPFKKVNIPVPSYGGVEGGAEEPEIE